jgi:hypothetical protein
LTATFAGPATGALYEAVGRVPSPQSHDEAPGDSSSAVQTLAVADTQAGAYFVDLDNPTSSPQSFTLAARGVALAITSVTPTTASFVEGIYPEPPNTCPDGIESG